MPGSPSRFSVHGDNIVECERTIDWILRAFGQPSTAARAVGGTAWAPIVRLTLDGLPAAVEIQLFPGFGRWDADILGLVRSRGGRLREAADAVLCRVDGRHHTPLLALEYCGALPAGNQAWQRSGRAYSFAHAGVPYFYLAEIGGFELDSTRARRGERMPNPAVPFSYLMLTHQRGTPVLPVFVMSPGAATATAAAHQEFLGEGLFLAGLKASITDRALARGDGLEALTLRFVRHLAGARKRRDGLHADGWGDAYVGVTSGIDLATHLSQATRLAWSKRATIVGLTSTARALMVAVAALATGLTSSKLPMCVVPPEKRKELAKVLRRLHPAIEPAFERWIGRSGPLAICWVMGFKPGGEDARPDRGLPPLCRSLVGESVDLLTVVYGPASADTWARLDANPVALASSNGLWESILACSDAVLVDASTVRSPATHRAHLRPHWDAVAARGDATALEMSGTLVRVGENDVDTIVHLVMARSSGADVFEGLCNPPGGDWSGISLLAADRRAEHRWLVLPRVTEVGQKRPDHVLQFFRGSGEPVVVAIESKDVAGAVEAGIGPRLAAYVRALVSTPPSVTRAVGGAWRQHVGTAPRVGGPRVVTGAAAQIRGLDELDPMLRRSQVDFVVGVMIDVAAGACTFHLRSRTSAGARVAAQVATFQPRLGPIAVTIDRGPDAGPGQ